MAGLYAAASGMERLEALARGDSPMHRLHATAKLLATLAYLIAVLSMPQGRIAGLLPFLCYPLIAMPLSETPARMLLSRLLVALPFALAIGLGQVLLLRQPAMTIAGVAVSRGALAFASVLLKTAMSVLAVLLLMATTPLARVVASLVALRVPRALCMQLAMTVRYLSVLFGEAARMTIAYRLRAPRERGVRLRDAGALIGQLLLRSIDRAERVYQAMRCRGFTGAFPTAAGARWRAADGAFVAAMALGGIAVRLLAA